jgi:hypothetical protein
LLIEPFCRDAIEDGKVRAEKNTLTTDQRNAADDVGDAFSIGLRHSKIIAPF